MNADVFIELGIVSSAHGLKGEILLHPHNPDSDLPSRGMTVRLADAKGKTRDVRVAASRRVAKGVLVLLEGVADRTQAEGLRGWTVSVRRGDLPPLGEGEFYFEDLPGLPVRLPDGTEVGRVAEVFTGRGPGVLVIDAGGREVLVPVVEGFVEEVTEDFVVVTPEALEDVDSR